MLAAAIETRMICAERGSVCALARTVVSTPGFARSASGGPCCWGSARIRCLKEHVPCVKPHSMSKHLLNRTESSRF